MDPRNERLVHRRMVGIACGDAALEDNLSSGVVNGASGGANGAGTTSFESVDTLVGDGGAVGGRVGDDGGGAGQGGSQYFLITPKLLPSLTYARGMRVLCIASGEKMPERGADVDFRGCMELMRGIRRTRVVAVR